MQDMTTGSVTRHLLKTTSFMLVTMIFQTLYFLVDLYWVGRLGPQAVAAVSIAGNMAFIVLAVTQMLSVGTTTRVSHAVGRKDQASANFAANQSQSLGLVCGLLFFVVATLLRDTYSTNLAADETTAAFANDFLRWFIPAMSLQFPMVSMSSALRGTGNFKPGMIVQTGTIIINIVLSPLLMFGVGTGRPLGVAGAALGSFIAIIIGTVWMTFYFRGRTAYLHFHPEQWKPRMREWLGMLKIGLPAGAEFALMAAHLFVVYTVARPFGAAAQAGFGIGLRIIQGCFLPVVALGIAVAPVAGQNFGAHLGDRVRATFRDGVALATCLMVVLGILCYFVPVAMMDVFTDDPQVIAVGSEYLRIVALSFIASGIVFVASSMFQAMGNTVPPLITSFARLLLVAIPVILMSRLPGFELRWIWWLGAASVWLHAAANVLILRREFRDRLPA
jgi:putative MATE family efflux protein